MCTLILSIDAAAAWPLLLASTRDEFRSRPWLPPARHWEERYPALLGGRDERSGGTWLAVDPARGRVAVLLNRIEPTALSEAEARSRGELPLLAAGDGGDAFEAEDLALFRPFNLVLAAPGEVTWWRYDGVSLSRHEVSPGLHILTAADLDEMSNPRQRHWLPRFAAGPRPSPAAEDRAPTGWGVWPELMADVDSPYDDPRAINVRRGGDGGVFGTVSASLLALGQRSLKYEFCPGPPDRTAWQQVI